MHGCGRLARAPLLVAENDGMFFGQGRSNNWGVLGRHGSSSCSKGTTQRLVSPECLLRLSTSQHEVKTPVRAGDSSVEYPHKPHRHKPELKTTCTHRQRFHRYVLYFWHSLLSRCASFSP